MKHIYRKLQITVFTLIFLVSASSCKKYFDLEQNPNLVQDPPLSAQLSTVTQKTALNTQRVAGFTAYFTQYLANPGAGGATDTYDIVDYTSTWDAIYFAMADIYDMKARAAEQGATDYTGVASILMAYHLSLVSDVWGSAPYADAFGGNTLTPAYDSEEVLYTQIGNLLDEGIADLRKTDSRIEISGANDLIHGGDKKSWVKTAYALKARLLNKISKKAEYDPAAVLSAIDSAYTGSADDAQMSVFLGLNPWAAVAQSNEQLVLGGWLSEQLIDAMNGKTYGVVDPRLPKITDPTATGTFVGTPNGAGNQGSGSNTTKDECYISRNSPATSDKAPLVIVSFAELKFVEAEAALRSGNRTRAYAAYQSGIGASMDKLTVAAAAKGTYLINPAVAVGASALTLDLIFKEKYIATYLNPEAWVDARRYDYKYKDFKLPVNAVLPTFIRRADYPVGERTKNGANVPPVTALSDKLWWDQ
ncbi:MAG: SusD/RagB family nutrient-binding outer membrane lipoprotein [Mucilaginibacter polytrichastri]|nr:SusD/RagB family nutrient-binding outer membrane lipoprotein [Mucilaginibacter polytrichastri]